MDPSFKGSISLKRNVSSIEHLGWKDSNLRMAVPKTAALPLGDTPSHERFSKRPEGIHCPTYRANNVRYSNPLKEYSASTDSSQD